MSIRFEVLVNGERICMSGINGNGVLSAIVNYVKHSNETPDLELSVSGLGRFQSSSERAQHAGWERLTLEYGDEVIIRLLEAGEFDDPVGTTQFPKVTVEDPDFGTMNYFIDAWDVDIDFDCPPLAEAHLHLVADESGPTALQRAAIKELMNRHAALWPQIGEALIRCHPGLQQMHELNERIDPRVCINMYDDSSMELTFQFDQDPDDRAYFVTLRDWTVVEVCSAD